MAVYRCLQDHADAEGCCWLAINTIAMELHLSRATVNRALDELCREGVIRKGGLQKSRYRGRLTVVHPEDALYKTF